MLLSCHMMNCFWIFIGVYSFRNTESSWIASYFNGNMDNSAIYLEGLYFIAATVTTVGFGDIKAYSLEETYYAMFAQVRNPL